MFLIIVNSQTNRTQYPVQRMDFYTISADSWKNRKMLLNRLNNNLKKKKVGEAPVILNLPLWLQWISFQKHKQIALCASLTLISMTVNLFIRLIGNYQFLYVPWNFLLKSKSIFHLQQCFSIQNIWNVGCCNSKLYTLHIKGERAHTPQ